MFRGSRGRYQGSAHEARESSSSSGGGRLAHPIRPHEFRRYLQGALGRAVRSGGQGHKGNHQGGGPPRVVRGFRLVRGRVVARRRCLGKRRRRYRVSRGRRVFSQGAVSNGSPHYQCSRRSLPYRGSSDGLCKVPRRRGGLQEVRRSFRVKSRHQVGQGCSPRCVASYLAKDESAIYYRCHPRGVVWFLLPRR